MRTPDDESNGGDPGSLAEGFGAADVSGDAYGDGFGDGAGSSSDALADDGAIGGLDVMDAFDPAEDLGTSAYEIDPVDVETDTDLDLTGDGVVDQADAVEGVTALFSFGLHHADDQPDPHAHHDDGGLFDV